MIGFLGLVDGYVLRCFERSAQERLIQALLEILPGLFEKVIGVHLEACGGIDENGSGGWPQFLQEAPVDTDHGIRGFSRTHDGDSSPGGGHALEPP
jgi:hypothetical protein